MEGAKPLDLRSLNQLAVTDRANLTARAEAGLSFKAFRDQLRKEGFYLDLPELNGSVGGLIASKVCPELKEFLLGLEVVTASGDLLELGGKTVKNVAGYDAVRMFCGSMGAYGVIIAATFALSAKPREWQAFSEPAAWDTFEPCACHKRLKRQLDPGNLLNPWVYRDEKEGEPLP